MQSLIVDLRIVPKVIYPSCCQWTLLILKEISIKTLYELHIFSDRDLPDEIMELLPKFKYISSLGISTPYNSYKNYKDAFYPDIKSLTVSCMSNQTEITNLQKFIETHAKKIQKLILLDCG